jgi:hypothetical protein
MILPFAKFLCVCVCVCVEYKSGKMTASPYLYLFLNVLEITAKVGASHAIICTAITSTAYVHIVVLRVNITNIATIPKSDVIWN